MSTPNFSKKNASKYFVVLQDYEDVVCDDEGNETDETQMVTPDEWEYHDLINLLQDTFEQKKGKFSFYKSDESEGNRSYPGVIFGTLTGYKVICNQTIEVQINVIIRSGYYSAANLDWELNYVLNCKDYDEIYDLVSDFPDECENKGLGKIHQKSVGKFLFDTTDELTELVENIFGEYSESYACVAIFSNGEAIYTKL